MWQIYVSIIRKLSILAILFMLPFRIEASGILEKCEQEKTAHPSIELIGLYGDKLLTILHETLGNAEIYQALDEALSELARNDSKTGSDKYFSVASRLYDIVHHSDRSSEEKKIAAQRSAHYFIKSLLANNKTPRVLLLCDYPQARPLLDRIRDNRIMLNDTLLNLLEKMAYDYWVFSHLKKKDSCPDSQSSSTVLTKKRQGAKSKSDVAFELNKKQRLVIQKNNYRNSSSNSGSSS